MKNLLKEIELNEELEAKIIMADEWNQFQVPSEIDERITELHYWNEEAEREVILKIMDEFDTQECYANKCFWFSTTNYHYREQEEAKGAFYQSSFCKDSCVPRMFRNFK